MVVMVLLRITELRQRLPQTHTMRLSTSSSSWSSESVNTLVIMADSKMRAVAPVSITTTSVTCSSLGQRAWHWPRRLSSFARSVALQKPRSGSIRSIVCSAVSASQRLRGSQPAITNKTDLLTSKNSWQRNELRPWHCAEFRARNFEYFRRGQ